MAVSGTPKRGDVIVMVGTRKGGFLLSSDASRKRWQLSGPFASGVDIFHMNYDKRSGALYTAEHNPWFGSDVQRSEDFGETWLKSDKPPAFAEDSGKSVAKVWHVEAGRANEPGVIYAGIEPASLFRSDDGGKTWSEIKGIGEHPTSGNWFPGAGGLCLHSMALHPTDSSKMWVGISAAGVFGTEDAGESWHPRNKGVRADFMPDNRYPEYGQCTHKLLVHPAKPNTLVQQNHCGTYRSDDGGGQWQDISEGLPSRFGFVMGLHSMDPDTYYVLPEDSAVEDEAGGMKRYVTDAKMRVFRSRDAGKNWQALSNGLPQQNAYLHVMREGMGTDSLDPCGIYVGTSTGQVFYSRDDGENWELMIEYLPPINSIEAAVIV
jgi:photosystem II stability/assembly factor-like uncharacterized protein